MTKKQQVFKLLSDAMRDGRSIVIRIDGEKGTVGIWSGRNPLPSIKFTDAYEALEEVLPEYMKELM